MLVSDQDMVLEPPSEYVILLKFIFKVIYIHVHIRYVKSATADLSI